MYKTLECNYSHFEGALGKGLLYGHNNYIFLVGYLDVEWARCLIGYSPLSCWESKKQIVVA